MTMKIVQVTSYYPPHLGGMENVVKEISNILASRNHDVEVFTSDSGLNKPKKTVSKNLKVYYMRSWEIAHTPIFPKLFLKLFTLPRDSIIHLHASQAFTPEIVMIISIIKKIPYIVHIHLDVDPSGFFGFLLEPYKKYILSAVLNKSDKVICLTEEQKKYASKKYNINIKNIEVVPNGVSKEFFIKRNKICNKKNYNLLFVGRLSPQKNLPFLIKSISQLKNKVTLNIVGDGEEKENIHKLIKDNNFKNIKMHGYKKGEELIRFYKESDLFLITSEKEGLSLSMLEAMAASLPVVGLDVPGVRELIHDCGVLVSKKSEKEYAKTIDNILSDKSLRKNLSQSSYKKAKKYTWEKVVDKLEKIYLKVGK
ncbi:MAG: glycosyltransferase family 4 protein [Candidatus Thorarchaeota archaeon]